MAAVWPFLRLDPNTPAQIAMDYYCTKSIKCLKYLVEQKERCLFYYLMNFIIINDLLRNLAIDNNKNLH